MKNLTARHVQGVDGVKHGVLDGWYAISPDDAICSGPFVTQAACETHIKRERADINAYHQGAANLH